MWSVVNLVWSQVYHTYLFVTSLPWCSESRGFVSDSWSLSSHVLCMLLEKMMRWRAEADRMAVRNTQTPTVERRTRRTISDDVTDQRWVSRVHSETVGWNSTQTPACKDGQLGETLRRHLHARTDSRVKLYADTCMQGRTAGWNSTQTLVCKDGQLEVDLPQSF